MFRLAPQLRTAQRFVSVVVPGGRAVSFILHITNKVTGGTGVGPRVAQTTSVPTWPLHFTAPPTYAWLFFARPTYLTVTLDSPSA